MPKPKPKPDRRPTLADVAERAGLSKSSASLILNNRPGSRLSADAAERVRAAAEELGYKPNPAAQSLRLGKTRTIGFISDEVTVTRYASGMIRAVLATARDYDHTVLIAETGDDPVGHRIAMESMIDRRVDGIVVGLMAARLVEVPHPPGAVPLVIVNGRTPNGLPSILPDEYAAGRAIADTLVSRGHRRIGIIGEWPDVLDDPRRSITIGERFRGIDEVLERAGVTPVRAVVDDWLPSEGYEQTKRVMREHPELSALLAGNDRVAFGIYQALAELGLRIPEDVSVVSFDDEELAEYLRPSLTTAHLPYYEMAQLGVEMVLGRRELAHELVPMPLMLRDSVRLLV